MSRFQKGPAKPAPAPAKPAPGKGAAPAKKEDSGGGKETYLIILFWMFCLICLPGV